VTDRQTDKTAFSNIAVQLRALKNSAGASPNEPLPPPKGRNFFSIFWRPFLVVTLQQVQFISVSPFT